MSSNLEMLQKLTLGKDAVETITIEFEDKTADFTIRPLTSGELTKLQAIEKKKLNVKVALENGKRTKTTVSEDDTKVQDVNINTGEFTESQAEAMYKAIAWSLSVDDEIILPEDVKKMMPGMPELIFEHVIRISKLSESDLTSVKSFLKK